MNIHSSVALFGALAVATAACKSRSYGEGSTKSTESTNPLSPYAKCYTTAKTSSYTDSSKKPGKLLYTCKGEREGLDICVIGFDGGAWVVEKSISTTDFTDDHIYLQYDKAQKDTKDELKLSITADEAYISSARLPNGSIQSDKIADGQMRKAFELNKKTLTATYRRTFKGGPTIPGYGPNDWVPMKGHNYNCRAMSPEQW
jgi:hypothetical protein